MTIKEVEEKTGLARSNIRFYEKEGLLNPKRSAVSGYRDYTEEDVLTLNRIKFLRMLDMPIRTIQECLEGRMELAEALEAQEAVYQEQMEQIHRNQLLCRQFREMDGGAEELSMELLMEVCGDGGVCAIYLENLKKQDRIRNRIYIFQQILSIMTICAGVLAAAALVLEMQYRTVGAVGVAVSCILLLILLGLIGRVIYLNEKNL